MSKSFTKLFSSITESTVWGEPATTRVAWVTMLAMSDPYGRVWASVPGLARRANITLEECQAALACFLSPDEHSRTPDHGGRRIEPIEGGWKLLNYAKYRETQDDEAQARRNADRQRRYRERHSNVPRGTVTESNARNGSLQDVTQNNPIAEAEAEEEAEEEKKKKTAAASRLGSGFPRFWSDYPKKKSRGQALKAWLRLKPSEQLVTEILAAIGRAKTSDDWRKEGGKFIPHPATWLNAEGWLDETVDPREAQRSVIEEAERMTFSVPVPA